MVLLAIGADDAPRGGYCRAMLKHEAKLIDPGADEIVAALTEATAATNKRCRARLLADDPAKWRKFARDTAAKPEGYAMFRGGKGGVPATQVLAAWWTDAIGRKHVVVRGRRVEHDEAKRLLLKDELETRPALWHAYPEYVCRRTVGAESQIVCACGCGAVGTPEALGWMGETCGPCFDRKEELGAGGLRANLPGVLYGDRAPLGALACSPDGNRVAAVEGNESVTYWDITARTRTTIKFDGVSVSDVAITSGGAHLLVVGVRVLSPGGLFACFDLNTDPPTRVDPADESQSATWRVAALPDPGLAIVHRPDPVGVNSLATVVRVPSGEPVSSAGLPAGYYGRFALSPDCTQVAACAMAPVVVDLESKLVRTRLPHPTPVVAFSHDGKRVYIQDAGRVVACDAVTGARVVGPNKDPSAIPTYSRTLAVDPAGKFVYAGSNYNGDLFVTRADTLRLCATFQWHFGPVMGLAMSADGSRLFSAGGDGCVKVWAIRDLLK